MKYILSNSNIGLAPYKDTFDFRMSVSNKFCEYTSYGLPILITSFGYMETIIKKYQVGLASNNVDEIRDFILKVKDDKKLFKKMSDNSMALYNKYFDADKIYPKLVKYLDDVKEEYYKWNMH